MDQPELFGIKVPFSRSEGQASQCIGESERAGVSDWPRPTTCPFCVLPKVIPGELPSELSPKLMRTIEYATGRTTRLDNNPTSKKTGWIPAQDLPRRNCQEPCQPCHGIVPQQRDCYASYRQADVRRGRCAGRSQSRYSNTEECSQSGTNHSLSHICDLIRYNFTRC